MKKAVFFLYIWVWVGLFGSVQNIQAEDVVQASQSAIRTEEVSQDLTLPKTRVNRMVSVLNTGDDTLGRFSFLRKQMASAVSVGVSVNTLVLLFLFPLVATLVAFSRQIVGVSGFGMITPTLLAMAFMSTGGSVGILMLIFVVGVAILAKAATKKVRIPYLPKLAVLLWMISMLVMSLLVFSSRWGVKGLLEVGIFPIVLFMSVAETFIEAQITRSFSASMTMLVETIILALVGYKIMNSYALQSIVLLNPEIVMLIVLLLNLLIGRYKGLRWLEVWRFRKLIMR